jgi:hypothetical protein
VIPAWKNLRGRIILSGAVAIVAACRLAIAGDGVPAVTVDPFGALFRLLTDFGALGAFITYLIWQRKRDVEKTDEDNRRWHTLDRELIGLVERCAGALTESTSVMSEIRHSIHENTKEMRRLNSRIICRKDDDI